MVSKRSFPPCLEAKSKIAQENTRNESVPIQKHSISAFYTNIGKGERKDNQEI